MSLTPERWAEVQRLFGRARELPAAEREAFVRSEAGTDSEVADEVLRMLRTEPEPSFLAPPEPPALPVPRRLGDFELLDEIGRGRFGVVYRARQLSLGRIVAVKVLMPSVTLTARDVERFTREPRSVARLHHPNIVQVLMVGEENGARYFAMDLIHGPNLAEEVKRLQAEHGILEGSGGHLPSSRAGTYFRAVAELARQAADGLSYAHQHGVVHRDVKPSNLILDAEGHVLIVDFGLARDEEQGTITKSDVFAGTPHYMSPEQASGYFHRVDQRTDVYSLGVVLYELLTLRRPFEGRTTYEILRNIREREAPRIRALNARVPRDLEVICNKAMAKDKRERYASAADLRDDLARFVSHEAIRARAPGIIEVVVRRARRHRIVLASVSIGLSAIVLGIVATRAIERRARLDQDRAAIRAARSEGPLRALQPDRLLDLRRRSRELRSDGEVLAAEKDDEILAFQRELDELRTALRQEGIDDLAASRDPGRADGERELRRLSGWKKLQQGAQLFPEDEDLRKLAEQESLYPRVSVRALDESGAEIPAEVYLREVNVLTSGLESRRLLGKTPLIKEPVLPGYYRAIVVFEAGGFREMICNPGPAQMGVELVARRQADESAVTDGMVRIDACSAVAREVAGYEHFHGQAVHLDAFWIDATEVSNAKFQRFLDATGQSQPRFWKLIADRTEFLGTYGDLPVIGVPWGEAVAYAEWSGKRLPTAAEWNRAAGGPEAWPTPYSSDPAAPARGNVSQASERPVGEEARWQRYLRLAVPVRSAPEAATPEGLFHMYGNVYELTESMGLDLTTDTEALVPQTFERFYFGGAWDAEQERVPMYAPNTVGISPRYLNDRVGFRCAKSAEP